MADSINEIKEIPLHEIVENRSNQLLNKNMVSAIINSGNKILIANTYMQIRDVQNQLDDHKVLLEQKLNFMFSGTDDQLEILSIRTSEVTKDVIEKASLEELKEFFIFDGKFVGLSIIDNLDEEGQLKAYRDFILYLREINDTKEDFDAFDKNNNALLELFPDEVKEAGKTTFTWDRYIYKLFKERSEAEDCPEDEKESLQKLMLMKDSALNLEPMKQYIQDEVNAGRRKSLVHAFRTRFNDTLKAADKFASSHKFKMFYPLYDNIEETIGYEGYQNLFVYIFARYVKFKSENFTKYDQVYIAQIIQNLIMLKKGQLDDASRIMMSNAIKEVLNILLLEE